MSSSHRLQRRRRSSLGSSSTGSSSRKKKDATIIHALTTQDPADVRKGRNLKKSVTDPSKSYLRSRRSLAREESRNRILNYLDKNVKELDLNSRGSGVSISSSHHSSNWREEDAAIHNGFSNLFHKKKRKYDEKLKRKSRQQELLLLHQEKERELEPIMKSSDHRRPAPPRVVKPQKQLQQQQSQKRKPKQQQQPQEQSKPITSDGVFDDDELIVQGVLRRYATSQCTTFEDHQEMAEAELIANMTNTSPTELRRLKIKLTQRLKANLGIEEVDEDADEDSSVDNSDHLLMDIYEDNESDVTSLTSLTSFTRTSSTLTTSVSALDKSSATLSKPSSEAFLGSFLERHGENDIDDDDGGDGNSLISVGGLTIMDGKYTGTICPNSGKPHGNGRLVYNSAKKGIYEGEWKQGRWNGIGKHSKPNGDVYEGQFLDNLYHGEGMFKYHESKRKYEGQYVMGERVKGTMRYADGSVYKGQFYHGRRHGRGSYTFKDGSRYKGDFVKDLMQGIGELKFRDGSKYVGEWKRGKHDGMGSMYSPEGSLCWAGTWKNGKQVRSEAPSTPSEKKL